MNSDSDDNGQHESHHNKDGSSKNASLEDTAPTHNEARMKQTLRVTLEEMEARALSKKRQFLLEHSHGSGSEDGSTPTIPGAVAVRKKNDPSEAIHHPDPTITTAAVDALPLVKAELVLDDPLEVIQVTIDEAGVNPPVPAIMNAEVSSPGTTVDVARSRQRDPSAAAMATAEVSSEEAPVIVEGGGIENGSNDSKANKYSPGQVVLLILLVIVVITLPNYLFARATSEQIDPQGMDDFIGEPDDCFWDPYALYHAQQVDFSHYDDRDSPHMFAIHDYDSGSAATSSTTKVYVICPGTVFLASPIENPVDFDFPPVHIPAGSSVRIQCGPEGSSSNDCWIDVSSSWKVLFYPLMDNRTVGGGIELTIQGFKWTKMTDSEMLWSGNASSSSMGGLLGHPGMSLRMEDCHWRDMSALNGLIRVGSNTSGEAIEEKPINVTLADCVFHNIVYDGAPLLQAGNRSHLSLQSVSFLDIRLGDSSVECEGLLRYCKVLIFCQGDSICAIEDVFVDNLEYFGHGALVTLADEAELSVQGSNHLSSLSLSHQSSALGLQPCPSGVARYGAQFTFFECQYSGTGAWVGPKEATCFSSTLSLFRAHIANLNQSTFVLCPNNVIRIGEFANVLKGDSTVVRGDAPLIIARPNVEVRCGFDGALGNKCVLDGGVLQILLQPFTNIEGFGGPIGKVVFRGLTFTGDIDADPLVGGGSMVVSNTGDVHVIDCLWDGVSSADAFIYVGQHIQQTLVGASFDIPPQSISLTITNSTVRSSIYSFGLIAAYGHNLTLHGVRFENVTLPNLLKPCISTSPGRQNCRSLVECFFNSSCTLQDVSVDRFEYDSPGLMQVSVDSQWHGESLVARDVCRRRPIEDSCAWGIAQYDTRALDTYQCLPNSTNAFSVSHSDWCEEKNRRRAETHPMGDIPMLP